MKKLLSAIIVAVAILGLASTSWAPVGTPFPKWRSWSSGYMSPVHSNMGIAMGGSGESAPAWIDTQGNAFFQNVEAVAFSPAPAPGPHPLYDSSLHSDINTSNTLSEGTQYGLYYTNSEFYFTTTQSGGVTDHGALDGLDDDDHTAYATTDELSTHEDSTTIHFIEGSIDHDNIVGVSTSDHHVKSVSGDIDHDSISGVSTSDHHVKTATLPFSSISSELDSSQLLIDANLSWSGDVLSATGGGGWTGTATSDLKMNANDIIMGTGNITGANTIAADTLIADGGGAVQGRVRLMESVNSGGVAYVYLQTDADLSSNYAVNFKAEAGTVALVSDVVTISTDLSDTTDLLYETELDDFSELQSQISDETLLKAGTLTDTYVCVYDSSGTDIVCNTDPGSFGGATALDNIGDPSADSVINMGASNSITFSFDTKTILISEDGVAVSGTGPTTIAGALTLSGIAGTNAWYVRLTDAGVAYLGNPSGSGDPDQDLFETFAVSGQSDIVADGPTNTITFAEGSNITITTNAGTKTITIASSGGGAGMWTDINSALQPLDAGYGVGSATTPLGPSFFDSLDVVDLNARNISSPSDTKYIQAVMATSHTTTTASEGWMWWQSTDDVWEIATSDSTIIGLDLTGASSGQVPAWNATTGRYSPVTVSGSGDMLKATYDADSNNAIDDTAIPDLQNLSGVLDTNQAHADFARDSELHTQSHDNTDHSTNYETPANVLTAIGTHSSNASSHHTATVAGDLEVMGLAATGGTVDYIVASDGSNGLVWKEDATGDNTIWTDQTTWVEPTDVRDIHVRGTAPKIKLIDTTTDDDDWWIWVENDRFDLIQSVDDSVGYVRFRIAGENFQFYDTGGVAKFSVIDGSIQTGTWDADVIDDSHMSDTHSHAVDAAFLGTIGQTTCAENEIWKTNASNQMVCAEDATSGGGANLFDEFIADGGTNPVAGDANDELSILGDSGVTTTGDAGADSITIAVDHNAITNGHSDGADVATNSTHRTSDGSDHSLSHTQGSDTALGPQAEDLDMNTDYQIVGLQAPAALGEAIRQTANVTETNLIALTGAGETALHSHAGGSGGFWTDETGYVLVVDDDDIGAVADKVASIYAGTVVTGVVISDAADGEFFIIASNSNNTFTTPGYAAYGQDSEHWEGYDSDSLETFAWVSDLHTESHDNTYHSTNYAVAGGAEHDSFSDFAGAEHLTPGDGLVENSGAMDVIKQTFSRGLIDSVTTADVYIPMGWANGECTVDKIVCRGTTYTSTITVYNDTSAIYSGLVCAVNTPGSETVQTSGLANTTLADGAEVSFTVTATGGSDPTMLIVQAECN